MNSLDYKDIRTILDANLTGFTGLIDPIQGMLCGYYVNLIDGDEGDPPKTTDVRDTIKLVQKVMFDIRDMCDAWGYEK